MGLRKRDVIRIFTAASIALPGIVVSPAAAQKSGGTLRLYNTSQPPSASIHEESTIATNMPFMAIFIPITSFLIERGLRTSSTLLGRPIERFSLTSSCWKHRFDSIYSRSE